VHIANVAPSLTVDQGTAVLLGANGEIDVSGRSLGLVYVKDKEVRKKELIAEIISHFSL
jgi:hypothetical protein